MESSLRRCGHAWLLLTCAFDTERLLESLAFSSLAHPVRQKLLASLSMIDGRFDGDGHGSLIDHVVLYAIEGGPIRLIHDRNEINVYAETKRIECEYRGSSGWHPCRFIKAASGPGSTSAATPQAAS